jgi:glycosyltransferase involved in cell wall biosynthesis
MAAPEHVVLILAYHYPPDTAIGGARPYRFVKYLKRMGYGVHVIASASEGAREEDVTYLPDPFYATPHDGLGWEMERFCRRFFLQGGTGMRWARRAAKVGRAFIRENAGRRITLLSTFPPLGPHFAGYLIAGTEPVPWIADFRDPLGDLRTWQFATRLHKASLVVFERITMRRVDMIVANTDTAAAYFEREYPEKAGSLHVIWNGFDPEERVGSLPAPDRRGTVLTHTGTLYYGRTPVPVLESLQRLFDSGRLPVERVKIRLIGSAAPACLPAAEFVDHATTQGWLDLIPNAVPRDEAVAAMRGSDALLLLQPQSSLQVPGKLFEYLLTGHPILAFVPRGSPVEWILQNSGVTYSCVHPEDSRAEMDQAVLAFFQSDLRPALPNAWFEEHFNAERQTEQLHQLITKLHTHGSLDRAEAERQSKVTMS